MVIKFLLGVLITIALVAGYYGYDVYRKYQVSRSLVESAKPFQHKSSDTTHSLLVLGDSTAVGVGVSDPEESLPVLYASEMNATYVENQAVSGAVTADLRTQIARASLEEYDQILIMIGGNDIIRFHDVAAASEMLDQVLATLPSYNKLVVMSAANVGGATFFPWFMRQHYEEASIAYHARFARVVEATHGTYVNLYVPSAEDPFMRDPDKYLAADGLHPSAAGYQLWFNRVKAIVFNTQ